MDYFELYGLPVLMKVDLAGVNAAEKDKILKYLLQLKGLIREGECYELDPASLREAREIESHLLEPWLQKDPGSLNEYEEQVLLMLDKVYQEVAPIVEQYRDGVTGEKELLEVKDYYYRKKYLERILDKMAQMRNIASRI